MPWTEACPNQRIGRVILIGVIEHRVDALNIQALTSEVRYPFTERPHRVPENLLEFVDLPIALIHSPILRLLALRT